MPTIEPKSTLSLQICHPELVSGSLILQIKHKTKSVKFEMLKQVQHDRNNKLLKSAVQQDS